MKRKLSYKISFVLLSIAILTAEGCSKKTGGDPPAATASPTGQATQAPAPEEEETAAPEDSRNPEATEEPEASAASLKPLEKEETPGPDASMKEMSIYTMNEISMECEDTTVYVPKNEKITSQVIVDAVTASFQERGIEVGIDSIQEDGDKVIVSFTKNKAPLENVGSTVESAILDCISQSLLDNLEKCKKVIFRVEGKAYESGHYAFDLDYVYLNK